MALRRGGAGNDRLVGTVEVDQMFGYAGNDSLLGFAGNDSILGGIGNDSLYGDVGDDSLYGGNNNDSLLGGDGSDRLWGDAGNDKLYGSLGNDSMNGGDGNDTLSGGSGNDLLVGGAGNDTMLGGYGNDTFVASGADRILGGSGVDTVRFAFAFGAAAVTVVDGVVKITDADGKVSEITGVENFDFNGLVMTLAQLTAATEDHAPVFAPVEPAEVPEDAVVGAEVATVAATDADGDTITYSITGGNDAGLFAIDPTTGVVTLAADAPEAGAETGPYTLTITANDGVKNATQELQVSIKNVNVVPEFAAVEPAEVLETAGVGAEVATVAATDADGDTITYSITGGNDAGLFAIDPTTGVVTLAADAPEAGAETGPYTLTITANDGVADATQELQVSIKNVNVLPTIAITDIGSGSGGNLTDTAVVTDSDNNFNGGSIKFSVADAYFKNSTTVSIFPIVLDGANFTLIGNQIVADASVVKGDQDLVIGTVDYGTLVDIDTADTTPGTPETVMATNLITINLTSDAVTSETVQKLVNATRTGLIMASGAAPAPSLANVTITVSDSEGATSSVTRLMNDSGSAMTLAGLDTDKKEIENDGTSTLNVGIDVGGNSTLTEGAAPLKGATVTVTSNVPGDKLHFDNQTQAMGAAGTIRVISGQIALSGGTNEKLIGTVAGVGANSLTITLNEDAVGGDITNILDSIQSDLVPSVAEHVMTTTIVDGRGLETETATSTFTIVGDFKNATVGGVASGGDAATHPLSWAAIDAALAANKAVVLTGNTYIALDVATPTTNLTNPLLTIPAGTLIRFVAPAGTPSVNLTGVVGLENIDGIRFGNSDTPLAANLTLNTAQADGAIGVMAGTMSVADVQALPSIDLSGLSFTAGTGTATATLAADLAFTGDLGAFTLNVTSGGKKVTMTADVADGQHITSNGKIIVNGVETGFKGDLRGLATTSVSDAVEVPIISNVIVDPLARLDASSINVLVAANATLTLDANQANAMSFAGALITGDDGKDGSTGGSIIVTPVDMDGTATNGLDLVNLDLTAITAGGFAQGGYKGTATMDINTDATISGPSNFFGTVTVNVAAGATVKGTAADVSGLALKGAGNMALTALEATPGADLSGVALTGSLTAKYSGGVAFAGDLGNFAVQVDRGTTFTTTAAIASGKTIAGQATLADGVLGGAAGGSVVITGLDAAAAYDLSKISAGAAAEVGDTAGTVTASIAGGVTLDKNTVLGNVDVTLLADNVTITAAQASGRKVSGDFNLTVNGVTAATDLSKIDIDSNDAVAGGGDLTLVADSTVNLSGNTSISATGFANQSDVLAFLVDDGKNDVDGDITVTLTASQANGATLDVQSNGAPVAGTTDGQFVVTAVTLDPIGGVDVDPTDDPGVTVSGSAGNDTLAASNLADFIFGYAGNDSLSGGAGEDVLTGGAGVDLLTGGADEDVFVFTAATDSGNGATLRDVITGFEGANLAGGDLINLATFAPTFVFIGTDSFTGTAVVPASQVRYAVDGSNVVVEVDIDGTGAADFQIQLNGVSALSAGDFAL